MSWVIRIVSIAIAIFVAAKLSQHLTMPPSNASLVWPGSGIALAVTILYGPRALFGIFLGAVVFEFQLFSETVVGLTTGTELILAFGLGFGASMQAFIGAELIWRVIGPLPRLVRDRDILRFQMLAGPVACLVSASISMPLLWSLGIISTANLSLGWLTWWMGDIIGAVIFAPLVLIFFNQRDPLWRERKITVALPMLLLLLTVIAIYSYASVNEKKDKDLRFHELVRTYHYNLTREFLTHLELLDSLKSHFDASKSVTGDEFHVFTETTLEKYSDIQALEWIPRIRDTQRAEFESTLPEDRSIRQLDSNGVLQSAGVRSEYYAIQFVEPADTNRLVFGFDITSNPKAAEALFRARDSGLAAATEPLRLAQSATDEVGIVIYKGVYETPSPANIEQRRESIIGVVAVVYRIRNLIESELLTILKGMIGLRLLDVTREGKPQVLYSSYDEILNLHSQSMFERHSMELAGRQWIFEYATTPDFDAGSTTWVVWVVLTGGLLITALLGSILLMLTGRTLRMEEEVNERTAELLGEVIHRRDAETQLRLVLEGANLGFWDWNYQTGEESVNDRWMEIMGLGRADLNNDSSDWQDRLHPDDKQKILRIVDQHIKNKTSYVVECRMLHRDGHWVWVQVSGAAVSHDPISKAPLRLCGILQDITERRRQEEHILHQAHFDSLTELPNRFLSLDRLSQLLNEALRSRDRGAVLFLDLDDFKKINDTMGHDAGDSVLKEVASRLQAVVRSSDTVGRLGGDEFIILIGGIFESSDAQPVAETLLNIFKGSFKIDSRELFITASIGISVYPNDGDNLSELLRNADSAMYHSKELGGNTYSYFTDEMNRAVAQRLLLEEQMHSALNRGEFRLCYQPKVELVSGKIIGVEALLRWSNPVLGNVSPLLFIPIAEQTGLIVPIGKFVLTEALDSAVYWKHRFGSSFTIAVNLSPRQFRDPNLVSFIEEHLSRSGIPAATLELEITEGVLMYGHAYIDDALAALNDLGLSIAMDDFGTGYSSLSYLRRYPFDVLKIDREFVKDLSDVPADRELVYAMIAMAHALGLKVVAEGVETEEQLNYLSTWGCDYGQGYLFSKAVTTEEIMAMLDQDFEEK